MQYSEDDHIRVFDDVIDHVLKLADFRSPYAFLHFVYIRGLVSRKLYRLRNAERKSAYTDASTVQ